MREPPTPVDETKRMRSLRSLRILDTGAEERFDRITRLAQRIFNVEICLISLVDSHRQWFKSKQGLDASETSRETSFCGHSILSDDVFVVGDASIDPRFDDNPLVTSDPHIRFYAGCPIKGPKGHHIGTLCLIDTKPRGLSLNDQGILRDLAELVESELTLASQATVDDLTQIANRRGFKLAARYVISFCRRAGIKAELVLFDLDDFKKINHNLGHVYGDSLLKHFAKLLTQSFRTADVIARLGGDEFGVLLTGSDASSQKPLHRLQALAASFECDIKRKLSWSTGRVRFDPGNHKSIENLINDADAQMSERKMQKRACQQIV